MHRITSGKYRAAGVDLDAAAHAKRLMAPHVRSTFTPDVLGDVGFFGALYNLRNFHDPVLVAGTDNVGTKLKLAALAGSWESVGQDVVNQNVNDIITCGARPLFFIDYIAMNHVIPERAAALVKGIALACRDAGCSLIGGETAELPGVYADVDGFDLAGFVVGAVERGNILDGSAIREGDVLIALPSSGLHTNGYSLVRHLFDLENQPEVINQQYTSLGASLGEALLLPHRSYWPLLEPTIPLIKGMAHITGGGLPENLPRVLPKELGAKVNLASWNIPPLFRLIQEKGHISDDEMFQVFNMGIGMVLISAEKQVPAILSILKEAWVAGSVIKHRGSSEKVELLP